MNIKKLIFGSSLLAAVPLILADLFIESVSTGTAKNVLEKQIDNQWVSLRESINTQAISDNIDDNAVALQYTYIKTNNNPLGSKDALIKTGDGSRYDQFHARYHPHIRDYLNTFGYYDIFLNGHTVQSLKYKSLSLFRIFTSLKVVT